MGEGLQVSYAAAVFFLEWEPAAGFRRLRSLKVHNEPDDDDRRTTNT
ncbi:hypothetical protein AGR8A_Cc60338 [Agrobacterium fabrum str. J-07]|nr:hypothetical protein AGR8A_Cc60338 [Agrobacterium fabrum str. J-07]